MFPSQTGDWSLCWYQLQPEMGVSLGGAAVLWSYTEGHTGTSLHQGLLCSSRNTSSKSLLGNSLSSQLTTWGMYQHMPFLDFRAQKEQTQHSLPKHHFYKFSYPTAFGGFQEFLEEVPSPAAFISSASLEMYNLYSSLSTLNAAGLQEEPQWQCTPGALPAILTLQKTIAVHSWSSPLHCTPQQLLSPPLARDFPVPQHGQQQSGSGFASTSTSKEEIRSHSSTGSNLCLYLKGKCSRIKAVEQKKETVTTSGYVPARKKGRGKKRT